MEVTTRGGRHTLDPPMSFKVEIYTSRDYDVVEK